MSQRFHCRVRHLNFLVNGACCYGYSGSETGFRVSMTTASPLAWRPNADTYKHVVQCTDIDVLIFSILLRKCERNVRVIATCTILSVSSGSVTLLGC